MKERWRLPFRIKVPERDELIAFGLATLAVGLMLGLAIGPMVTGAARFIPVIVPPLATGQPDSGDSTEVAEAPALGSPAGGTPVSSDTGGGGNTLVADAGPVINDPGPSGYDPGPSSPPVDRAAVDKTPDPEPEPDPDPDPVPEPEGVLLTGTVLANSPSSRTYWLSADGEVATVFAATVPDPGLVISTHVVPLSNGTLTESAGRSAMDISKKTLLKATVSYIDPIAKVAVLSGRGASLPVAATTGSVLEGFKVGERVEATLTLKVPDPINLSDEQVPVGGLPVVADPPIGDQLPIRLGKLKRIASGEEIELTGKLVETDEENRVLSLAADSTGKLESTVELGVPEEFPFEIVKAGRSYSTTVNQSEDGILRMVGLSPASGKAAANDPARAFGTHLR